MVSSQRSFPLSTIPDPSLTCCSWTYIQPDAPKYYNGHTINFVGQIAVFFLSIFGILYCARENRLRAAGKRDHRLEGLSEREQDELGYRHPRFHYWT